MLQLIFFMYTFVHSYLENARLLLDLDLVAISLIEAHHLGKDRRAETEDGLVTLDQRSVLGDD